MSDKAEMAIITLVIIVVMALAGYAAYCNEVAWQAYAKQHHCIVTGRRDGQLIWTTDYKGNSTFVQEPDQNIYACDGGEIIIR